MAADFTGETSLNLNDPTTRRKALMLAAVGGAGLGLYLLTRRRQASGIVPVVQDEGQLRQDIDLSVFEEYLSKLAGNFDRISADLYGYVDQQIAATNEAMNELGQQLADAIGGVYDYMTSGLGDLYSYGDGYPASLNYNYSGGSVETEAKTPTGGSLRKALETLRDALRFSVTVARMMPKDTVTTTWQPVAFQAAYTIPALGMKLPPEITPRQQLAELRHFAHLDAAMRAAQAAPPPISPRAQAAEIQHFRHTFESMRAARTAPPPISPRAQAAEIQHFRHTFESMRAPDTTRPPVRGGPYPAIRPRSEVTIPRAPVAQRITAALRRAMEQVQATVLPLSPMPAPPPPQPVQPARTFHAPPPISPRVQEAEIRHFRHTFKSMRRPSRG